MALFKLWKNTVIVVCNIFLVFFSQSSLLSASVCVSTCSVSSVLCLCLLEPQRLLSAGRAVSTVEQWRSVVPAECRDRGMELGSWKTIVRGREGGGSHNVRELRLRQTSGGRGVGRKSWSRGVGCGRGDGSSWEGHTVSPFTWSLLLSPGEGLLFMASVPPRDVSCKKRRGFHIDVMMRLYSLRKFWFSRP